MADIDYKKAFSCPSCGTAGNIYLVKVAGSKTVVKQRCPVHGGRAFKVPTKEKDQYIQFIQDGVYRCYKCGEDAKLSYKRIASPWTIVKTSCPTHGALTTQKIWSTIYDEISKEGDTIPQYANTEPIQAEPSKEEDSQEDTETDPMVSQDRKFCPNCGARLEEAGRFCGECGSKIE